MSCPSKRSRCQRPRYASSRDQSTSHSLFALHVTVGARAREGGGGGGGERLEKTQSKSVVILRLERRR